MTALAGLVNLIGPEPLPHDALGRMSAALKHRGAWEGRFEEPGVGLAWRRTAPAIVPAESSPASSTSAAFAGWLTNQAELRHYLESRGRAARTDGCESIVAALWEEHGEALVEHLRGQFACAVWDRRRRTLFLARDRIGMAPLYWAQRGNWLLFASEIKALLASGLVAAEVDRRGLDHVMTFMAMSTARTCFQNVQAVPAGHCLLANAGALQVRRYWDLDFPNRGDEERVTTQDDAVEQLRELLRKAVTRRLPSDGPAAAYISGGIDCSTVAALAGEVRRQPLPTFTVRLDSPDHDESDRARRVGAACGAAPVVETFDAARIIAAYPQLIRTAEQPVADSSSATLMLLAERARNDGYSTVLAGDGADDLFAGYPWFKTDKMMRWLDILPGFRFSQALRRLVLRFTAPHIPASNVTRTHGYIGGHSAWLDLWGLVSLNRSRFYSREMRDQFAGFMAYEDLSLNLRRMRRWHPLNRALYLGMKVHVPGLLLQAKGDRIAMRSGVELRWPYLDEDVIAFATRLRPDWKLHGLRDKYLLRRVAERWLPHDIAWRPKRDFVAPFDNLYQAPTVRWVDELLSDESLRRTGYFDPVAVRHWRKNYAKLSRRGSRRFSVELGLATIVATQLWHHQYIDASLADVPG